MLFQHKYLTICCQRSSSHTVSPDRELLDSCSIFSFSLLLHCLLWNHHMFTDKHMSCCSRMWSAANTVKKSGLLHLC